MDAWQDVYQVQVSNFGEDSKDAIATSKVILGLESFSGQRNLHVKYMNSLEKLSNANQRR